jgi:hypothetical protein
MSLKLVGEISGGIVAGLILIPLLLTTIRTALDGKAPTWNPSDVAAAEASSASKGWLYRSLTAFDIAFNVIVLRGEQDETISTHAYRAFLEGKTWGKIVNTWLGWFQPNHGARAASGDLERATARVSVLKKILGVQ